MNNVNIKHIDFSTVLKRKTVVKSKSYYAQGWLGSRPTLKIFYTWNLFGYCLQNVSEKSGWKVNRARLFWSRLFLRKISGSSVTSKKKIRPTLKHVLRKDYFQCFHFIHLFTKLRLKPVSNVVLLQCRTKLIELNSTLARQTSATFETK